MDYLLQPRKPSVGVLPVTQGGRNTSGLPSSYPDVRYNPPSKLDMLWSAFQQNEMAPDSKLQGKTLGEAVFGYPGEHGPANPDRAWEPRGDAMDSFQRMNEGTNPDGSPMGDAERLFSLFSAPIGGMGRGVMAANQSPGLLASHIAKLPQIAKDMGVSEDIAAGLMREGKIAAEVNPISTATGKEVGFHTPYSGSRKVKTAKLDELTSGFEKQTPDYGDLGISDIEDFSGQTLFPMALDRTSRDMVSKVNNVDVGEYSVPGGYRYWLEALKGGGDGMASGHSVMSNYKNISDALKGEGVGVGTVMSGRGSDFATAGTDIAKRMGMFDNMSKDTKSMLSSELNIKITAGNAATVKAAKKKAKEDGVAYVEPKVTGQVSDDLNAEFIARLDSEPALRKAFMEAVDLDRVAKNPEIIDAITLRHAITDDRFRHLTRGESDPLSGMDFIKLKGDLIPSANAPSPNPSYSHHMQGDYKSPLLVPTPRSVLFPEFTDTMISQSRPPSEWNYMFDRMKPRQKVDQRVIDEVNQYKDGILKGF
tara:strand:+ start:411 stop:2015 length:1605 start_codon:yes stop_codon:yes gene_type:complete